MIPVPVDYEALAAAALSETPATTKVEEQQEQVTKVAQTIDFTCPFCDAELHLNADLGGKREPCPECKRIIKVPMLVQERAKDWRTVQQKTGPSGALANLQQPQLEGVWDTTQKTKVSTEALEDADAIIEEDEDAPGVLGWVKRVVVIGGVLGVIVLVTVFIMRQQSAKTQADAMTRALEIAEGKGAEKADLSPAWRAEIFRAAGEFYINTGDAVKALTQFKKARGQFPRAAGPTPLDQDIILMRLAVALVDLGGTEKEADDNVRLEWPKVQRELLNTLNGIGSPEGKTLAVREVTARLLKKQQPLVAVGLVGQLSGDEGSPIKSQWVGLVHDPKVPLKEEKRKELLELVKKQVPAPDVAKGIYDKTTRLGYAEAMARAGEYDKASQIVEAVGSGPDQVEAALIVADIADETSSGAGRKFRDFAFQSADKQKDTLPLWLRLESVRAAARTGDLARAKDAAKTIPVNAQADFKSWAALEILHAELAATRSEADVNLVSNGGTDKNSPARALAWELLAQHNIRYSSDIKRDVETADDPRVRPFLLAGIALGTATTE
jgi:hypothetical protein